MSDKYRFALADVTDGLLRRTDDRPCFEKIGVVMFQCVIQQHVLEI